MNIEKFENNLIAFDFENEMVNATDMLKGFSNKRMSDYLRLKSTKELKSVLESKTGNPVLTVKHGGSGHGTWMHKYLAYDFASWLNVEFKLFVYNVFDKAINEKLKHQQIQLDYFWDKEDQKDLYRK